MLWRRCFRRSVAAAVVAVPMAAVLAVVPGESAYALAPAPPVVPVVAAGTAAATGGVAACVETVILCPAGLVESASAAIFTGVFWGTTGLLHWAFDPSNVPDAVYGASVGTWSHSNTQLGIHFTFNGNSFHIDCSSTCGNGPTWNGTYDLTIASAGGGADLVVQYSASSGASSLQMYASMFDSAGHGCGFVSLTFNSTSTLTAVVTPNLSVCPAGANQVYFGSDTGGVFPYATYLITGASAAVQAMHKWESILGCSNEPVTVLSPQTWREGDVNLPAIPIPQCTGGGQPQTLTVKEVGADGETTGGHNGTTRLTWTAPDNSASPYPDCVPGGAAAPCDITLKYRTSTGVFANCTTSAATECVTFDPTLEPYPVTNYQCDWGTYVLPTLGDCAWFQRETGSSATATPEPTATGGPQPLPTTGVNTDPRTGTDSGGDTGPAPDPGDTGGSNCMGGIWSWNPVDWVYIPIKCALTWAFVPSTTALETDVTNLNDAWDGSAPGFAATAAGGVVSPLVDLATDSNPDCEGLGLAIDIDTPSVHTGTMHPFQSCTGLSKYMNDFYMPVITFLVLVGGFISGLNTMLRAVGLHVPWWGRS